MPEPISIVTNELPPEFNDQGSESLTSNTRSSVDVSSDTSKEESKANDNLEDGHSAKKTCADDGELSDESSPGDGIKVATDKHKDEASSLKKVDDMLSTVTNKILPPEFNDQRSESLTPMTRSPSDDSSATSREDSKAKEDSEHGHSAEKTAADDGELSDKGSLGNGIDGINVVSDKHKDEASSVKKVDDTSRANSQVNPQHRSFQFHGDVSSAVSKGYSNAKEDSEDGQSAEKTAVDDDGELSDNGSLGDGIDSINIVTDKHEDEALTEKKVDHTSRENSQVNPQNTNNLVNDQGSKSLIPMTQSPGDVSSATSTEYSYSNPKEDSEDVQSAKWAPADDDGELLGEVSLDHGVGGATDKLEARTLEKIDDISRECPNTNFQVNPQNTNDATDKLEELSAKKINDISRLYQHPNSQVNPQHTGYQDNDLIQMFRAMESKMCNMQNKIYAMENEIKQLKAAPRQSREAVVGCNTQEEEDDTITLSGYEPATNQVSKVVAEVPDRSDVSDLSVFEPTAKEVTDHEVRGNDSFTGAEINCEMMENSGVNRSAEGEEEVHDERYSRLKISKNNQGDLKPIQEYQGESMNGNKKDDNVRIAEVITKRDTNLFGNLKDDTSYRVQTKFDGAEENNKNIIDTEQLLENDNTHHSNITMDPDSPEYLDSGKVDLGVMDDSDISRFGDDKEGGYSFYHIDAHESSESHISTDPNKANGCSHTSQRNLKPRGKIISPEAQPLSPPDDNLLSGYRRRESLDLVKKLSSKRWIPIRHKYSNTRRKTFWVSPQFKLVFCSLTRAAQFDELCPDGTEADKCAAYLHMLKQEGCRAFVVGGKHALQNAMLKKNVDKGSSSNIMQDLPHQDDNNDGGGKVKVNHIDAHESTESHISTDPNKAKECTHTSQRNLRPRGKNTRNEAQALSATAYDLLSGYTRPEWLKLVKRLTSKGWTPKLHTTSTTRIIHWVSPEFHLEFVSLTEAARFDKLRCNTEADKCAAYLQKLTKEGDKARYVMGGKHALQNAMSKKNIGCSSNLPNIDQDLPSKGDNDDECFVCSDGGGEKKNY
eukprot:scaffold41140_cov38-Cyclotella_meneghiniana.AAC.3